jgi:hypothetical protein
VLDVWRAKLWFNTDSPEGPVWPNLARDTTPFATSTTTLVVIEIFLNAPAKYKKGVEFFFGEKVAPGNKKILFQVFKK